MTTSINDIAPDNFNLIVLQLGFKDLLSCSLVCKKWNSFFNEDFWKRRGQLEFPSHNIMTNSENFDWKKWLIDRMIGRFISKSLSFIAYFESRYQSRGTNI